MVRKDEFIVVVAVIRRFVTKLCVGSKQSTDCVVEFNTYTGWKKTVNFFRAQMPLRSFYRGRRCENSLPWGVTMLSVPSGCGFRTPVMCEEGMRIEREKLSHEASVVVSPWCLAQRWGLSVFFSLSGVVCNEHTGGRIQRDVAGYEGECAFSIVGSAGRALGELCGFYHVRFGVPMNGRSLWSVYG